MTILKKLWRIALLINILSLFEPLFSGNTNHLISYWIFYGGVSAPFYVFFCLMTTIKGKEREMKNELMSTSLFFFRVVLSMHSRIFYQRNSRHHRSNDRDIHVCDVRYAFPWISWTSTWREGPAIGPFYEKNLIFSKYNDTL